MCEQKNTCEQQIFFTGGDNKQKYEIIIFLAYFGRLPSYYYAWEKSVLQNSTIDFYIFSDIDSLQSKDNIHVEKIEFCDFVSKIKSKFSFPVKCGFPYKICDYKPALGDVFSDIITKYDFWGYCDADLVFGNIRKFVTDDVLSEYDRCFHTAHLSLYRNCDRLNKLYLSEGDYPEYNVKEAYSTNDACYFDEFRGMELKCLRNGIKTYSNANIIVDIPYDARIFGKDKTREIYYWENGSLKVMTEKGDVREILYCHYQKRDMVCDSSVANYDKFVIVPNTIKGCDAVEHSFYEVSLSSLYPIKMKIGKLVKAIKKYGLKKLLSRRKRQMYVKEIKKKYESANLNISA